MTGKAEHDFAPERAATALLLVDVLNHLEFDGGAELLEPALAMAATLARFKARCREAEVPAIYVNDNFGRWQSNIDRLVQRILEENLRGAPLVQRLLPSDDDYRVLKPERSAFLASPLDLLLRRLEVRNLIVTGLTSDRCVTFTVIDAHMRDYRLFVPEDTCAAMQPDHHREAIAFIERVTSADVTPSTALDLAALTT